MNKTSKRILAIGLPLAAVAATGVAFAYWTGSGSGSAGASAAGSVAGVTLAPTAPITGLVPGGEITVPVTATNPNLDTSVSITTLTTVDTTLLSNSTACDAVSGVTVVANQPAGEVVVPAANSIAFGSITISMPDSGVNQDACKSAVFTVDLTAAAS